MIDDTGSDSDDSSSDSDTNGGKNQQTMAGYLDKINDGEMRIEEL